MKRTQFESLIAKWRDTGLVTPVQAQTMLADVAESSSEHSGKQFIHAVGILGAFALASGILLMISRISGRFLLPDRAFCPFVPRPEVFPLFPPRPILLAFF